MMGLEVVFLIVIVGAAVAYALGWRPQFIQNNTAQTGQTPGEILKTRLARGEIAREEYERMRRDLEN